ncbi:ABC transporter substrate-binding protein [Ilumatobacter sp.]|uniref:ABC transporter substrate-binding protein n=1 Tax=Ilumatobacter sp. TaxID=1967498 RepID=UPI003C4E2D6E
MNTSFSRSSRVLAGLAIAVVAVGCGGSDDDSSSDATDATSDVAADTTSSETEAPDSEPVNTDAPDAEPASTEAAADDDAAEPAADLEPVVIRQACAPTASSLAGEVGQRNGLSDEYAISFECVQVGAGPEIATAMVTDAIDLAGFTPSNAYVLLEQDVDLALFRQSLGTDFFDIIVSSDFPLPSADQGWEGVMSDLAEARIGVVARGAAAEDMARGLYTEAGLDPDQATFIATGLPKTTLAALSNGEIDAALTFEPGISLALTEGIAVQPFSMQEGTGPERFNWPGLFLGALREKIETEPELFNRYMEFSTAANEYMADPANREEVNDVAADFLGLPPEAIDLVIDRTIANTTTDGTIDSDGLDRIGEFFAEIGRTETAYTADEIVLVPSS